MPREPAASFRFSNVEADMRFSGLARAGLLMILVCVAGLQASVAVARPNAQAHSTGKRQPEIYLLRGFGDVFSTGLDEMGERLAARGIEAHVDSHTASGTVARTIIADARRGRVGPVILIGHSLGANGAIRIAEQLQEAGIKVDLLVSLAATSPHPVPANVRRAVNYYFKTHGWGEPLVAGPGFHGRLLNKDYSDKAEVGHFNIDKQKAVQNEILGLVRGALR